MEERRESPHEPMTSHRGERFSFFLKVELGRLAIFLVGTGFGHFGGERGGRKFIIRADRGAWSKTFWRSLTHLAGTPLQEPPGKENRWGGGRHGRKIPYLATQRVKRARDVLTYTRGRGRTFRGSA